MNELRQQLPSWLQDHTAIKVPLLVGIGVFTMKKAYNGVKSARLRRQLNAKRFDRRRHCENAVRSLSEKLESQTPADENITRLSSSQIKDKISNGSLQAKDVLRAFQTKALSVHKKTNCLVEPVQEAELFVEEMNKKGILAGIPISIKDDVAIAGYPSVLGASKFIDRVSVEDSALLKALKSEGAIPFVRTNEPQLGLSLEPGNPVNGIVLNPHDLTRGPGGSSAGECALIGSGGSVLGFGSDLGGSLRAPASFCGVCTFKATHERVSRLGYKALRFTGAAIPAVWGPISRDVDTLVLAMKALWNGSMVEADPLCPPLMFDNSAFESTRPLRIGYFYDDGFIQSTPAVRRAVDMATSKLRELGHEVVEWTPPDGFDTFFTELAILFADGGQEIKEVLDSDKVDRIAKGVYQAAGLPGWLKKIVSRVLPAKVEAGVVGALVPKWTSEYWELEENVRHFARKVVGSWRDLGLDAVVSPAVPVPAMPLGSEETLMHVTTLMMLYNICNFPAGTVRMTKVTQADLENMSSYPEKDKHHKSIKKAMEGATGLPIGVQVAALCWQDETCLRVMKDVEKTADFTVV